MALGFMDGLGVGDCILRGLRAPPLSRGTQGLAAGSVPARASGAVAKRGGWATALGAARALGASLQLWRSPRGGGPRQQPAFGPPRRCGASHLFRRQVAGAPPLLLGPWRINRQGLDPSLGDKTMSCV